MSKIIPKAPNIWQRHFNNLELITVFEKWKNNQILPVNSFDEESSFSWMDINKLIKLIKEIREVKETNKGFTKLTAQYLFVYKIH